VGKIVKEMRHFEYKERMIVSDIDVSRIHGERLINSSFKSAVNHFTDEEELESIPFTLRSPEESQPMDRVIERNPFMPEGANPEERCHEMFQIQVCGLIQRLKHMHAQYAVIGISGGLDSALALLVTTEAFDILGLDRKQIIAITMPGFGTSERTYRNAHTMMTELGVTVREISIKEACEQHLSAIGYEGDREDATFENVQARERTQILMDLANIYRAPVIGTGDLSEIALGWCTFNGDQMSMYAVNSGITKTSVQLIVKWYAAHKSTNTPLTRVLKDIVATPISPELLPIKDTEAGSEQHTQSLVGPYELHDFFIYHFLLDGFEPKKIFYLAKVAFDGAYTAQEIKHWMGVFFKRFFSQQFKRNAMPDGPKVISVSLSSRGEWRMPSDAVCDMWLQEVERLEV